MPSDDASQGDSESFHDRLMNESSRGGLKTPRIVQEAVNEATRFEPGSARLRNDRPFPGVSRLGTSARYSFH